MPEVVRKQNNMLGYILIFMFLLASPPFVFQLFPGMPDWQILYIITFPPLLLYAILKKKSLFRKEIQGVTIAWCFGWLFFAVIHQDSIYISRIAMALISAVVLSIVLSLDVKKICKIYIYIILAMAIAGTVTFFLVYFIGLSPIFEYENLDGKDGFCFGLTCTNTYNDYLSIFRYSGFFDEPGAMGLWGLYAVFFNKLLFDNRKIELILILCLVFTFSIGFYVSIIAYLILFYFNWKSKKMIAILLLSLMGFSAFISTNVHFYKITVARLQYDESTGTIAGNNRNIQQENAIKYFSQYPLFGVGANNAVKMAENGIDINDNIMSPFAKDGLVGMFLIYFPFFYSLFRKHRNKVARNCLWVFALTFFHRGVSFIVFNLVMYLILLLIIDSVSKSKSEKRYQYVK